MEPLSLQDLHHLAMNHVGKELENKDLSSLPLTAN